MTKEYVIASVTGPVYVNETGDREEVLAVVYLNETVAAAAGGFKPCWAMGSNQVIQGNGVQA